MNNQQAPMFNMNQINQQLPNFKAQMQQQGITDPRAEVMKRLQGQAMNSPKMQHVQQIMNMLGLHF